MKSHRDRRARPSVRKKAPAPSGASGEGLRLRCLLARSFDYATALRALPVAFSERSRPLPVMSPDPGPIGRGVDPQVRPKSGRIRSGQKKGPANRP